MSHNGVKMHTGAVFRQLNSDYPFSLTMFKQCLSKKLDSLWRGAFRHADQHGPPTNHQHITTF